MRSDHSLLFGAAFGFVLARAGATDPRAIRGMFQLTDPNLLLVIGLAIGLTALLFLGFRRGLLRTRSGAPVALEPKPWRRGILYGAALFGAGWALAGSCPGTALAQIGEGRLGGLATFAGILLGIIAVQRWSLWKVERSLAANESETSLRRAT